MNPYIAPLDEISFVLRELADIKTASGLEDAEVLADEELTDAILEQAARFAQGVLAPLDSVGDQKGATWSDVGVCTAPGFDDAYRQFVESGWNNVAIPAEYGGQGLPTLLCTAIQEMFISSNKSFCFCPELTAFAVKAIVNAGTESLKSLYVPKLVSGQWAGTMNLTEPQAGSDVGALRTRAEPQPDGSYRIFGQKIFISYGDHDLTENIVHLVLARIPGAPQGSRGVSLFLVPKFLPDGDGLGKHNDVQCSGIEHKLGNHGSPTCTLVYGSEGEGATGWLVGEENKGLQAMFVMVNSARFNVGLEAVALSEKAYQQSLNYARERVQGRLVGGDGSDVPIIQHPDVRRMLLFMRSQTEAMRSLAYVIAAERDIAERHSDSDVRSKHRAFVDLLIPVFKGWATEVAIDVTSTSIQVHGGLGYIEESGVSQPLRDVRVTSIYEGTTSIQAHDLVERKIVRDGGATLRFWISKIHITQRELSHAGDMFVDIASAIDTALCALQEASEWCLSNYLKKPQEVLGGSVALLKLCGILAGGWLLARGALAAQRYLDEGKGDSAFMRRKIHSSRFYVTHIMAQCPGLSLVAINGGNAVTELGKDAF